MPPWELAAVSIFILLLFAGVYATIVGLPGTVLILANAFLYALLTGFHKIGVRAILLLLCMAIVAEAFGLAMEAKSRVRLAPSWQGFLASLIGGFVGALFLTPWLWGLGTLLGIFLGGFTGFFLLELYRQKRIKPALRISSGAVLSSALGVFTKGTLAIAMTIVTLSNIYS